MCKLEPKPSSPCRRRGPDGRGDSDSPGPPAPASPPWGSRAIGHSHRSLTAALRHGQALLTACKLQVFDVLKERGPLAAADVAREIDASVGGTARLLDVCAALGLLDKSDRGEGASRVSSRQLRRRGPAAS